jgi:outer membrane receptor for monomeric catechols
VLTGAQRSRGLELGLERSISDRWQVSAGYAWQKAGNYRDHGLPRLQAARFRWFPATPSRCGTATM